MHHHSLLRAFVLSSSVSFAIAACGPNRVSFDTGPIDATDSMDIVEAGTDTRADTAPDVQDVHADTPPPDAHPNCNSDSDCHFDVNLSVCDTASHTCVHCTADGPRICATGFYCDSTFHCAVGCNTDADCNTGAEGRLACDPTAHVCRGCTGDSDCPLGTVCSAGACVPGCNPMHDCPLGLTCCGGMCANTSSDTMHCGGCTNVCMGTHGSPSCVAGVCSFVCASGFGNCDHDGTNGCESDTLASATNCGTCGNACDAANTTGGGCVGGICMLGTCMGTFQDCNSRPNDGCESDVQSDANNCGTCGHACGAGEVCNAGVCGCPTGFMRCGTTMACVDTTTDVMNCGACGMVCPTGMVCGGGTCTMHTTHYMQVNSPPGVTFIDACATAGHMEYLAGADDGSALVSLPFAFHYWATDMAAGSMINISSNGFISLDGIADDSLFGMIPSTDTPNAVIAPHWGDDVNGTPGQCVATVGTAPRRQWVAEWQHQDYCCGGAGGDNTYEIILSESTNTIDLVYQTMSGTMDQTMGIEDQTGMMGINACPGGAAFCSPTSGETIRFVPVP